MKSRPQLSVSLALFVVSMVLFGLVGAGIVPDNSWRGRVIAWGLFCWGLSEVTWF